MNYESLRFWQRNQVRFERFSNLLLLNTFLSSLLVQSRTPFNIFVNSVPKSGTNLLMKTLRLFPTIRDSKISLHSEMPGTPWRPSLPLKGQLWKTFPSVRASFELGSTAVIDNNVWDYPLDHMPIGGFHSVFVPTRKMEYLLSYLKAGWFAAGHMPFSPQFEEVLIKNNIKMILITRDPRDVINSELKFFLHTKNLVLHKYYNSLTWDEGIRSIIFGVPQSKDGPNQPSIKDVLLDFRPWLFKPYVYVTKFEDLVGSQGGGDNRVQTEEIKAIAKHLELAVSDEELINIKSNMFGGTHTFRKGVIGSWKRKLSKVHRLACNELIGDLLMELGYEDDSNWV